MVKLGSAVAVPPQLSAGMLEVAADAYYSIHVLRMLQATITVGNMRNLG
jgi:hypothetical protein